MKDFEKIEHLLLSKRFEELSPTEAREVTGYFENATDYNDMRDTLMQVKSTLAADKLLIKPNVELKEKLLQKFDNIYTNHSSATIRKTKPFYKNIGFQWSAAATIVLLISLSIFGYIQNINSKANNGMAVNYEAPASKDHSNVVPDDGIVSTGENEKSKITTVDPKLKNPIYRDDEIDEINVPKSVNPTMISTTNQPNEGNRNRFYENKNYGTFGTTVYDNNTTIPVTDNDAIIGSESKKENSILTKNGFISTNIGDDKKGEILQGDANDNRKEDQNMEPLKTTIPAQTEENSINYKTNDKQNNNITDRAYFWKGKNKNENKGTANQVSLGLAQEKRLEADSIQFRLDSLQLEDLLRARQLNLDENK